MITPSLNLNEIKISPHKGNFDVFNKTTYLKENMYGNHWLDIDPNWETMTAMHIKSWSDEFELKLLIKFKLRDNGFDLDKHLE